MQSKSTNRAKLIAGAVLAGMLVFGSAAKASIVIDVRATLVNGVAPADPKNIVLVSGSSNTVTLGLFLDISNADSNHANDGYITAQGGINSIEATGNGVQGNLTSMSYNGNVATSVSQAGLPTNLDSNPDLELGDLPANAGVSSSNWVIANATTTGGTVFGSGSGAGVTEIPLGTTTWTQNALGDGTATSLDFYVRPRTSGTASAKNVVKYVSDGVETDALYTDPSVSVGSPVSITEPVPEPASLSLLGLATVGLMARRRRA